MAPRRIPRSRRPEQEVPQDAAPVAPQAGNLDEMPAGFSPSNFLNLDNQGGENVQGDGQANQVTLGVI